MNDIYDLFDIPICDEKENVNCNVSGEWQTSEPFSIILAKLKTICHGVKYF
jgi:hypothetical protein